MGNEFEQEIPGSGGSIGKIGFDMECDGMREYVNKMYKKTKIDQVLDFYGIPYIYKNEYKRFLKYRIQKRHYPIVNDHFLMVLRHEGYQTDDFDYGALQDQYNIDVPVPEQTALDLHVNYDLFMKKDKEHRDAITKQNDSAKDGVIMGMQQLMQDMMKEMSELKKIVGKSESLLSKNPIDDGNKSEPTSTRNPEGETSNQGIALAEKEETGRSNETQRDDQGGQDGSKQIDTGTQGPELIGSSAIVGDFADCLIEGGNSPEIFKLGRTTETKQEPTKDRRQA